MKTYNNLIATQPFVRKAVETKVKSGFALSTSKTALHPLEVVFECADLPELKPGDRVYVRSDFLFSHAWAKEELELNGEIVILVPKQFIFAYDDKGK